MSQQGADTAWRRGRVSVDRDVARALDAYWRCANYLSVGQIYLRRNPLLTRPLAFDDLKPRPLGHWGTIPGLNFLYAHINRLVAAHARPALVVVGPGHGGPAGAVSALLDGTLAERYPAFTDDESGLAEFMRSYSAPHGLPGNCTPMLPGSIHTGGELGYTLSHAFGAALDSPGLLSVPIVGDGEAEEAAIAAAWGTCKLMSPVTDGTVLPVLHMNGYKITTPSMLAASTPSELEGYFRGLGYEPMVFTAGFDEKDRRDPVDMHLRFAELLEDAYDRICAIRERAAAGEACREPYPIIIFRSPKGWTTPDAPEGTPFSGTAGAHELPLRVGDSQERLRWLEAWLRSYHPEDLFDEKGSASSLVRSVMPQGGLRLGANPAANGGAARIPLDLPDPATSAVPADHASRGSHDAGLAAAIGAYTRDVMRANPGNFRLFSPDELSSNHMQASLEVTGKQWNVPTSAGASMSLVPAGEMELAPSGKVLEVLSEHQCEGLLEGYVLTGRHGIWATYEAFAQITGSMVAQHCKWLEETVRFARWRDPVPALNILLTSHVWRQDHNGFSHQDPGFVDVLLNKSVAGEGVAHIYYPADVNMALAVARRCYASVDCVNAIVAGKQASPVFTSLEEAERELEEGAAAWEWASTIGAADKPDLVVASVGDAVTVEALAASALLAKEGVRLRFVNVVDLLRLASPARDAHAMPDGRFEALFGADVPVLFCFHGYEGAVWRLIARRPGATARFDVHGYMDQGATTTPFGMLYDNRMDRYALAVAGFELLDPVRFAKSIAELARVRDAYMDYAVENACDHPSFAAWRWGEDVPMGLE